MLCSDVNWIINPLTAVELKKKSNAKCIVLFKDPNRVQKVERSSKSECSQNLFGRNVMVIFLSLSSSDIFWMFHSSLHSF